MAFHTGTPIREGWNWRGILSLGLKRASTWEEIVSKAGTCSLFALVFERRDRVHAQPAEGAQHIGRGGHVERQVPIAGVPDDIAAHEGGDEPADVAHHVHGAGEGGDRFAAYVHAGRPRAR